MATAAPPYPGGGYQTSQQFPAPSPYPANSALGTYGSGGTSGEPATLPAQPTAPPVDKMERIQGYEGTTFDQMPAAPPSYFEATGVEPPRERPVVGNIGSLNEEQVREALGQFVSEHCCYGKKPVVQMIINDIVPAYAYHYTLETWAERREISWAADPYDGQMIDGPSNGPAPGPWQINVPKTIPQFQNGVVNMEVPHTASVKPCHACLGLGRRPCLHCMSMGSVRCMHCNGTGHRPGPAAQHQHGEHHHHHHHEPCVFCHGSGRSHCHHCGGSGQRVCDTCRGRAQLKCYIKLIVTFTNHMNDNYVDRSQNSTLPSELVKQASGNLIFDETLPKVWPMVSFPDQTILEASRQLVNQHATAFPTEFIHCQRQRVKVVPVTHVFSKYKNKEASFYVYGLDNKIHFPDYFVRCCGCCTIV